MGPGGGAHGRNQVTASPDARADEPPSELGHDTRLSLSSGRTSAANVSYCSSKPEPIAARTRLSAPASPKRTTASAQSDGVPAMASSVARSRVIGPESG